MERSLKHKPGFFIVGAPKSGTTAMNNYLAAHPDIYMLEKELHYWGHDLHYMYPRMGRDTYEKHLKAAPHDQLVGEGAVWYLVSETAAQELHDHNPQARIIIMLRDPVEMLYSMHAQLVYRGNEPETSFEKALALQEERRNGRALPNHYYNPAEAFQYYRLAHYAPQVERYLNTFGREQVLVIFYEEMKADMAEVYRQVLRFLQVDESFRPEFKVVNPSKTIKSEGVRNVTLSPPPWLKSVTKTLLPSKAVREAIKQRLWQWNTQYRQRPPMQQATRQQLSQHFKAPNKQLEALLQRPLPNWQ